MQILTRTICERCNGDSTISSAIWQSFYDADDEYRKQNGYYMSEAKCLDWFSRNGYSKLPPEEPTCHRCNGTGHIEKWMDLQHVFETGNIVG